MIDQDVLEVSDSMMLQHIVAPVQAEFLTLGPLFW